jgi:ABC-type multidrug transport system fused ATPase/permease subunit
MQNAFVNTERLMNTQELQPMIGNQAGAVELTGCLGRIEFDLVRSGTLHYVTFRCEGNTVIVILGLSTSERLIFWQLLFRLIDPTAGRILIDGRNVQNYTTESFRRFVAVVHQRCELGDGSIEQYIKYGLSNPDSITNDMLERLCKEVNIHSTIMKFPGGYCCQAGRREISFNGEKTRRLALARSLIQNRKIIVIDKMLLPLDGESEEQLQGVMKAISRLRTIIVVE